MHSRFLVLTYFGQTAIPCRSFETYASAHRFARTLRRASVRLILTPREWLGLYWLACTAIFAAFVVAL